jgi:hypothetical protein
VLDKPLHNKEHYHQAKTCTPYLAIHCPILFRWLGLNYRRASAYALAGQNRPEFQFIFLLDE